MGSDEAFPRVGNCCPHPVERHAYNGCANCGCGVPWLEHPDRDLDRSEAANIARAWRAELVSTGLRSLGAALVQAAALTRAHVNGYRLAAFETGYVNDPACYWAPGCRRPAP